MTASILSVEQLLETAAGGASLFGLDLGTKTIGIAVGDLSVGIATPVTTLSRGKFTADAETLAKLARDWRVSGYVLGLPNNMDGSEGPRVQATKAFARNFARVQELPIALWDERLSTSAVERALIAHDVSRARRAQVIDQHAAAFILQGALDRLRMLREG
jgi:putative holliday junction resolvase